jgi:hypothetical protein
MNLKIPLVIVGATLGLVSMQGWATATGGEPIAPGSSTGLNRCVDGSGVTIFTDRSCDQMHATDAPAPSAGPAPSQVIVRTRSCARSQDELLSGVRNALESHDPNRLAEFYHWSGMGNSEGYRLMKRLGSFSERPLLDVQLVASGDPYSSMTTTSSAGSPGGPDAGDGYGYGNDSLGYGPDADPARPAPRPARTPAADRLRVDQMRGEQDYDAEVTIFRLRSNAGCWWLQF